MGRGLKGIVFGGIVGATLGILYAPRSGKKTRKLLAEKTEALWGEEAQANGTILGEVAKTAQTAFDAGQSILDEASKTTFGEAANNFKDSGQNFARKAKDKAGDFSASNVRPVFSEKNDELRKKIDIARDKIAKQVAKNAANHSKDLNVEPNAIKAKITEIELDAKAEESAAKKEAKKIIDDEIVNSKKSDNKTNSSAEKTDND